MLTGTFRRSSLHRGGSNGDQTSHNRNTEASRGEPCEDNELSKKQAEAILAGLVGNIVKHLKKGERIRIGGLGILQVRKRAARMGRNPATGEAIQIKASKKGRFPRIERAEGSHLIADDREQMTDDGGRICLPSVDLAFGPSSRFGLRQGFEPSSGGTKVPAPFFREQRTRSHNPISEASCAWSEASFTGAAPPYPAAVEDHRVRHQVQNKLGVLLDEDHRHSCVCTNAPQRVHEIVDQSWCETLERFVEQKHLRVADKRTPNRQHLLLAA